MFNILISKIFNLQQVNRVCQTGLATICLFTLPLSRTLNLIVLHHTTRLIHVHQPRLFRIRYWYFKFYLDGYLYEHLLPAVTNNILWSIYNLLIYYWRIVFKKQCFIFLWLIMLATISRYIKLYSNDKIYLAVNDKHVCKFSDWKNVNDTF